MERETDEDDDDPIPGLWPLKTSFKTQTGTRSASHIIIGVCPSPQLGARRFRSCVAWRRVLRTLLRRRCPSAKRFGRSKRSHRLPQTSLWRCVDCEVCVCVWGLGSLTSLWRPSQAPCHALELIVRCSKVTWGASAIHHAFNVLRFQV